MSTGVAEEVPHSGHVHESNEGSSPRGTPQHGNLSDKSKEGKSHEEGVEVVLGDESNPKMVEPPARPRQTPDQNVFRHPQAVRPRAVRAQGHHPHQPPPPPHHPHHPPATGSWGYGHPPPPPHHDYHGSRPPYPVPPYNPSGSFDEHGYHRASHYSPHISYPPYRAPEDVNVISPSHGDPRYRPPMHPRGRHMPPPNYYHYPPASPVSRPGAPPGAPPDSSPRMRDYGPRRDGPYSKVQRDYHDGYPPHPTAERSAHHPTVVTESSFDSEHHSRESMSHPTTPASSHHGMPHPPPPPPPPASHDPHYQFYGGGGSWGSFDSAAGPPPHFDDQRYYGFPPPDSPYGPYNSAYSPNGLYPAESFPPPQSGYPPHPHSYAYSYDEEDPRAHEYYAERREVTPSKKGRSTPKTSNKGNNSANTLLPKAAEEIDFDVTDPPMSPVTQPSEKSLVDSLAEVNTHDVLCGRGGGTNSQIGNRRFRKLVQEFQPTYLLARRKEKPLLARTIVLIIRKRGGRFLKKDEDSGELFEVGDAKAEAKTSQALREGLDVRATKSAASSLLEKKKKKQQQQSKSSSSVEEDSPRSERDDRSEPSTPKRADSPPIIPRLHETAKAGIVHPHSPEQDSYRKRRRTRSVGSANRFFPDFCPPRADLGYRPASPLGPEEDDMSITLSTTPIHRNNTRDEDDRYAEEARGCAGIAFDVVTGAATGSFCLGPSGWRR